MTCVRTAWLVLGANTVYLEDAAQGYFCSNLDLGYPEVREVVNNRPDQDGVDDRTRYFGSRPVTADITALHGANPAGQIDRIIGLFAPFMSPASRPVLHYVLDRPGTPERTITLRAAAFAAPISGADQRDIHLQWVAADPVIRAATTSTVTAWPPGSYAGDGRTYPLSYNRTYPAGTPGPPSAVISSPGDVPVQPVLRVYGPITAAAVTVDTTGAGNPNPHVYVVRMLAGYVIGGGAYVDIDTKNKSATLNGTTSVLANVDWLNTTWPVVPRPAVPRVVVAGRDRHRDRHPGPSLLDRRIPAVTWPAGRHPTGPPADHRPRRGPCRARTRYRTGGASGGSRSTAASGMSRTRGRPTWWPS